MFIAFPEEIIVAAEENFNIRGDFDAGNPLVHIEEVLNLAANNPAMLAQVHFPDTLSPEDLDHYLADGWFRMGQTIFTTNFLNFKQQFYSAIWLRIDITDKSADKRYHKLMRQNSQFRTDIKPASITQEKEDLFQRYRSGVSFEASSSLHQLMFSRAEGNVFNTWEILVYDGDTLIGCGFFDLGHNAGAGITSFYDPDYKKYSLGRFLILLKVQHCAMLGLRYFYPGYFVPGYSAFDYKLKIKPETLQFLDLASNRWLPIRAFTKENSPLARMVEKLDELKALMKQAGIDAAIRFYEFFDAALVPELSHLELFDFPVFLHYFDLSEDKVNTLIVYDVRDQTYHCNLMKSLWASKMDSTREDHYGAHLLEVDLRLFSAESTTTMLELFMLYQSKLKY